MTTLHACASIRLGVVLRYAVLTPSRLERRGVVRRSLGVSGWLHTLLMYWRFGERVRSFLAHFRTTQVLTSLMTFRHLRCVSHCVLVVRARVLSVMYQSLTSSNTRSFSNLDVPRRYLGSWKHRNTVFAFRVSAAQFNRQGTPPGPELTREIVRRKKSLHLGDVTAP